MWCPVARKFTPFNPLELVDPALPDADENPREQSRTFHTNFTKMAIATDASNTSLLGPVNIVVMDTLHITTCTCRTAVQSFAYTKNRENFLGATSNLKLKFRCFTSFSFSLYLRQLSAHLSPVFDATSPYSSTSPTPLILEVAKPCQTSKRIRNNASYALHFHDYRQQYKCTPTTTRTLTLPLDSCILLYSYLLCSAR